MKQKFADALHAYKRDVFKVEHDPAELKRLTQDSLHQAREALDNSYHYHFHRLEDANRAEIINMINNYAVEALLPPVVEKLVKRQLILERKLELLVHLLERELENISEEAR